MRQEEKINLNTTDDFGKTPLLLAVDSGYPEITRLLLEGGAQVNHAANDWMLEPLPAAINYNKPEIAHILLEHGADINLESIQGNTPLKLAKQRGNQEIIKILKQAGAKE